MGERRIEELLEAILVELRRGREPPRPTESLSIDDAAARLGCSRTQVFALLRDGTLQRTRRVGRNQMVLASSVESALVEPVAKRQQSKRAKRQAQASRGGGDEIRAAINARRQRARAESERCRAAEPEPTDSEARLCA